MLIAIDFDNTIVCYDGLFHRVAVERGLIPAGIAATKNAVRDHLRATGREADWTELQGEVYGARMPEAVPFTGVREFFKAARAAGIRLVIVSHKTRHPFLGIPHDLHAAAQLWLEQYGFFSSAEIGLARSDVWFELTKQAKLARIAACGATHCIDDLPEILSDPAFPASVRRLLFDPQRLHPVQSGISVVTEWSQLHASLLGSPQDIALARLGLVTHEPGQLLNGGANNRASRHLLADGRRVLVKHYAPPAQDGRDRFATERAFYRYIASSGISGTASAHGWEEGMRVGVLEWIDGSQPGEITHGHVDQALRFILALNSGRQRPEATALPDASEACFSLAQHASVVERRLAALQNLPGSEALVREAESFVHDELRHSWNELLPILRTEAGPAWDRVLTSSERCISPSDFGFHNSILTPDSRLVFCDFEYAGWDDPAKLVCDFFCQPDRPAPPVCFDSFARQLAEAFPPDGGPSLIERAEWLLPVYRIKWACILLNEFTAVGRARREFSLGPDAALARRARQLARARAMLSATRLAAT